MAASVSDEKDMTAHHDEEAVRDRSSNGEEHLEGIETELNALPKGYFFSRYFLGSVMAIGLGLWAAVASFGYAAPVLAQINADIGPDPRYTWISLVYNAALACFITPLGRLSDIFGRRYFFIGGGIIGVVGSVVCATAQTIPVLIGGNVLLGICSATQMSFHFVMGELVPLKYRYIGIAVLYFFTIPGSGFAPSITYAFMSNWPDLGWRGIYWFILAINAAALICWTLFYFPPTFRKKHQFDEHVTVGYWLKHFDWIGFLLMSGGFVSFLLGLSWGGVVYPWKSAATIASIVLGVVVMVLFVVWELYAPLREPLIPLHLFRNIEWLAAAILLGLGAGVYYAFAIIWPMQVNVLYNDGDMVRMGVISSLVGVGIISGQISGGMLAKKLGKTKIQCFVVFLVGGVFLACVAVGTPDNQTTTTALMFLGTYWIGWNESVCLANVVICLKDQREVGVAGGLAASLRAAICAVMVAIYTTILSNRLTQTITATVPSALIEAGLPAESIPDFIGVVSTAGTLAGEEAYSGVAGVKESVINAGVRAYQVANADAYRTVYLSTIAFSGVAILLTFFAPNTEKYMTDDVAATLNREDDVGVKAKEQHGSGQTS
ncbi:MFS general substrate transporter [Sarocladium strictum]